MSANSFTGRSFQQEELQRFDEQYLQPKYLTTEDFDEALQQVETGTITLPDFGSYSNQKKAQESIDCNGQKIVNMDANVDFSSGISGVASTAVSIGLATLMFPNTGPQNLTDRVSMGNKIVGNVSDPLLENDVVNLKTMQVKCLTRGDIDADWSAQNKRIYDVGDPLFYKQSDITVPDPIEINTTVTDTELLRLYSKQAINLESLQRNTVCLDTDTRTAFDSLQKQIKNGKQATDAKDYVTLDQVVHEESKNIEWIQTDGIPGNYESKYIFEDDRIVMVQNPKTPVGGQFLIQNAGGIISGEKQVANLAYVKSTCHEKKKNIDMEQYRVTNMAGPIDSDDAVIKSYCDSNSKNNDGTGLLTGLLGGILGGGIGSALTSGIGSGLSVLGQISGSIATGTAVLSSGIKIGSSADFDRLVPSAGETQQLIDNLKSDIVNGGQPDGGALMNGALSISGLMRSTANSLIGIFDTI